MIVVALPYRRKDVLGLAWGQQVAVVRTQFKRKPQSAELSRTKLNTNPNRPTVHVAVN